MGLRFRKSFKIAPGVKLNLNKKSSSITFGGKGVHYTINSKGKKTASVGIPGTGLSYSTSSGGSQKTDSSPETGETYHATNLQNNASGTPPKKKKGRGCLTAFIILFILGGIASCFDGNNTPEKISLSASSTAYDINESIPIDMTVEPEDADITNIECESSGGTFVNEDGELSFSAEKAGTYELSVVCGDIESNAIKITVEDKKAIAETKKKAEEEAKKKAEEEAKRKAEEEAAAKAQAEAEAAAQAQAEAEAQAATQAQQQQEQMVWISATGSKYHSNSSCGRMNPATSYQMTISEAQASGYGACQRCH